MLDQLAPRAHLAFSNVAHRDSSELAHLARHIGRLHSKLQGRTEDQHLRIVGRCIDTLQTGDQEGRGLACARLRLSDRVVMRTGH